jgi:hypothetical protein
MPDVAALNAVNSKARESGREGGARRKIGFLLTYGGSSYMWSTPGSNSARRFATSAYF